MKRLVLFATAAIVALASCTKTQVVYNDAPEQITFKQVTNAMTKATTLSNGELGVFAHQGDDLYFGNTKFTWEDDANAFTADEEWPQEGNLDFTVYYPYDANAKYDVTSKKLTVPALSDIEGVYYGEKRYTDKNSSNHEKVVLNHVCAKITVTFENEGYSFVSATIASVNTAGNVEVDYSDASAVVATVAPTDGTITTSTITFATSGAENYVLPGIQQNLSVNFTQNAGSQTQITRTATLSDNWEANKHYTYNVKVTPNSEITFTAETKDWDPEATEPSI